MPKCFNMNKKQSFSAVLLIAAAMLTSTIGLYGSPIVNAQSYGGLGGLGGPGGLGSPLGIGGLGGPGLGGLGGF
jgi:hypothetical protein